MKIKEIERIINRFAPNNLQESYDNSGLLVGNREDEVSKILISLDVTDDIIDEAISKGCDMIISHHPLIFKGLKRLNGDNYVERIVLSAIKNNIAIYSLHTNLDNVSNGVNSMIFEKLNLNNGVKLRPKDEDKYDGAGLIGFVEKKEAIPYKDFKGIDTKGFLGEIKNTFEAGAIKHTKVLKDKVRKIAVCGGSGSFLLKDAIKAGADVFITSDFTYHQFFDADSKILIVDIGHYEFEQFTTRLIFDKLIQIHNDSSVELFMTETNTNPVSYL